MHIRLRTLGKIILWSDVGGAEGQGNGRAGGQGRGGCEPQAPAPGAHREARRGEEGPRGRDRAACGGRGGGGPLEFGHQHWKLSCWWPGESAGVLSM